MDEPANNNKSSMSDSARQSLLTEKQEVPAENNCPQKLVLLIVLPFLCVFLCSFSSISSLLYRKIAQYWSASNSLFASNCERCDLPSDFADDDYWFKAPAYFPSHSLFSYYIDPHTLNVTCNRTLIIKEYDGSNQLSSKIVIKHAQPFTYSMKGKSRVLFECWYSEKNSRGYLYSWPFTDQHVSTNIHYSWPFSSSFWWVLQILEKGI